MKRVIGWAGAGFLAAFVVYHVFTTSSFLLSLIGL
jgi:hypothetical protein